MTLNLPLATLRAVDEAPYRAAIAAGVRLVMTSWAVYPALDPRRPAGLSSIIIERELRGRLHFRGVTVTDGIQAGALAPFGSVGPGAPWRAQARRRPHPLRRHRSGGQRPVAGAPSVRHALADAIAAGTIRPAAARSAAAAILALRAHP